MKSYRIASREQTWYGEFIGVPILDTSYPCIPGNVGSASTFDLPVDMKIRQSASIDGLLNRQDAMSAALFTGAARNFQRAGVKAITGAWGFYGSFPTGSSGIRGYSRFFLQSPADILHLSKRWLSY